MCQCATACLPSGLCTGPGRTGSRRAASCASVYRKLHRPEAARKPAGWAMGLQERVPIGGLRRTSLAVLGADCEHVQIHLRRARKGQAADVCVRQSC